MPYPEEMCAPMRKELTSAGFEELKTEEEVDNIFNGPHKSLLIFVNSVCGCAAGSARPGVIMSLENSCRPEKITTVFAGQDLEATKRAREYMLPYPPSSPCIALFQNLFWAPPFHWIEYQGFPKSIHPQNLDHLSC